LQSAICGIEKRHQRRVIEDRARGIAPTLCSAELWSAGSETMPNISSSVRRVLLAAKVPAVPGCAGAEDDVGFSAGVEVAISCSSEKSNAYEPRCQFADGFNRVIFACRAAGG
jgi:hypothetical protein